jgi:hypothetical protein
MGTGRSGMGRSGTGWAGTGRVGTGRDGLVRHESVGDKSVGNGSVAKKVSVDPPSFYWFLYLFRFIWGCPNGQKQHQNIYFLVVLGHFSC